MTHLGLPHPILVLGVCTVWAFLNFLKHRVSGERTLLWCDCLGLCGMTHLGLPHSISVLGVSDTHLRSPPEGTWYIGEIFYLV